MKEIMLNTVKCKVYKIVVMCFITALDPNTLSYICNEETIKVI